jgi:UDP-2,3-diacylglucosamine hydrolase
MKSIEPIGLIAGAGGLPLHFAQASRKKGRPLYLFAIKNSADPRLCAFAEKICWASPGQVGALISFLKNNKVRKLVFHGKVQHGSFFTNIRLDWKGLALWSKSTDRSGPGLLKRLGEELEKEGLRVLDGRYDMGDLLVKKGFLTRSRPHRNSIQYLDQGLRQARTLAKLGIGQSIVVKSGAVAAVEAMEGTDETLLRAGKWSGRGTVLVKTASPNQDWRFDVPTIGLGTLQNLARIKASGLVMEAGRSFLLDKEKVLKFAEAKKIFLLAV